MTSSNASHAGMDDMAEWGVRNRAMATLTTPRGSMGEEPDMGIPTSGSGTRDPHCAMDPQCPGALGKGCYLCEPGSFDSLKLVLSVPLLYVTGTGAEWSGIPGDPFITLARTRTTPHGAEPWDHASTEAA